MKTRTRLTPYHKHNRDGKNCQSISGPENLPYNPLMPQGEGSSTINRVVAMSFYGGDELRELQRAFS